MKIYLLSLLTLVGCGSVSENDIRHIDDPDTYLAKVKVMLPYRYSVKLVKTLEVVGSKNTLGQCELDTHNIVINTNLWYTFEPSKKLWIIAHEYIHCSLGILHSKTPETLMYPFISEYIDWMTVEEVIKTTWNVR